MPAGADRDRRTDRAGRYTRQRAHARGVTHRGRALRDRPRRRTGRDDRRLPAAAPALAPARRAARAQGGRHLRRAAQRRVDEPRAVRGRGLRAHPRRAAPHRRRCRCSASTSSPAWSTTSLPSGVRIADADRVRLGAHLASGTTVMHEGFVTTTPARSARRWSRAASRPASSSATARTSAAAPRSWARSPAAAREQITRRQALPDRRQRGHRHLARRRLRRRGGHATSPRAPRSPCLAAPR